MRFDAVTLGHVVLDDLHRPDGSRTVGVLGGAGTYAALGQATVTAYSGVVSGIGEDFPQEAHRCFRDAGIDTAGLVPLDPRTPRTIVDYFDDGERAESSLHGSEHFSRLDPAWEIVPASYRDAAGIYVFDALNPPLWERLARTRREHGTQVLWEIRADLCRPENLGDVAAQLSTVDVLSINRAELRALTGRSRLVDAVDSIRSLVPTLALRLGGDGALVVRDERSLRALPLGAGAVDPTGAGNAFSGAFLARWAKVPGDAERALRAAMAAAELTIRQVGPPHVTESTRDRARDLAREIPILPVTASMFRENGPISD